MLRSLVGSEMCIRDRSNGMVERMHRTLKERLMSRALATGSNSWMDHLPFVLLGLRASVRADSACAPSDLVYGAPLRFPGDMVDPSSPPPSASSFSHHLHTVMRQAAPMPVAHHGVQHRPFRIDPGLAAASHVLLRVDAVRRPLVPPYEGPFLVVSRSPKTFVLRKNGKDITVSIDRLKPAFLNSPSEAPQPDAVVSRPVPIPVPVSSAPSPPIYTASGRVSRPTVRFQA